MTTMGASAAAPRSDPQQFAVSLAGPLVAPATAIVILAVSLLLLMTPLWMHFALNVSGGYDAQATPQLSYALSDRTVSELFFGPGSFAMYGADEAAHMGDVRNVLLSFLLVAALCAALVGTLLVCARRDPSVWRSMARGGAALAVAVAALGVFAALAFGVAFELFHRILFSGGNWAFPQDSLLIRLYPYGFWQMTAAAFGVLSIGGGVTVWAIARRRARTLEAQAGT